MSCETSEGLIAHLESALPPDEDRRVVQHLETCAMCRATMEDYVRVRGRLVAAAHSAPLPSIDDRVMAAIASAPLSSRPSKAWLARYRDGILSPRVRRLAFGTGAFVLLVVVLAAGFLWEPSEAWTIEQSVEATRPFHALRLRGRLGGGIRFELWARSADGPSRDARLLMRFQNGLTVWTDGNATHYYDPASRVLLTDDAQTAGFQPWPGPELFELARKAGIRQVETRWRFPGRRTVVTEWSFVGVNGPTSARAEFDLTTKMLVGVRQWQNLDLRGEPAFESDDISYLADLPDGAFAVDLPTGLPSRLRDVEVKESLLGLLSLDDAGVSADGNSLEESSRAIVNDMWRAVIARDLGALRRLSPVTRDEELSAVLLEAIDGPDGVVAVESVEAGVARGHSALGPVTVVASRVRHRNGGLYEQKFIVQHRLARGQSSCVIVGPYGNPYRLE